MASCLGFLVATVGLFATVTCFYDPELKLYMDDRYNKTVEAVVKILWKNFENEIKENANILFFTTQCAIDIDFMIQVFDKELMVKVSESIPLYETFDVDLKTGEQRLTFDELHFKTIFVGSFKEMDKRRLIGHAFKKLSKFSDRFQLIVNNKTDNLPRKWDRLSSKVMESGLGVTCAVRYCAYPTIIIENAPFAMLTFTTWNITSLEGFSWTDHVNFFIYHERDIRQYPACRSIANYDYAEFQYSKQKNCTGRVVRLPYKKNFHLVFVIASTGMECTWAQEVWDEVKNVNLGGLTYERKLISLTIPYFKVAANIDLRTRLNGTALADAFDKPSSRLYNALAFQAAEINFSPQYTPPPTIPQDKTTVFTVDRPFFFGLFHKIIRAPIFASLIKNPICGNLCEKRKLRPL